MHPHLEGLLKKTYGVIVYQDQVMQIANRLAGFSPRPGGPAPARDGEEEAGGDGPP